MSNFTNGTPAQRMEQWISLCEQSMATGEVVEIMEEAKAEIAALSEKEVAQWQRNQILEKHNDSLEHQLSQAKELMQLVTANNAGGFGHDDGVVAIDGYVIHKHAIDAMSTWLAQQEGEQ